MKIDVVDHTKEEGFCKGLEIGIYKRISLSRNGYLFSKDNARFLD